MVRFWTCQHKKKRSFLINNFKSLLFETWKEENFVLWIFVFRSKILCIIVSFLFFFCWFNLKENNHFAITFRLCRSLKFFTLGLILQFPEESWQIFKKKLHNSEEKKMVTVQNQIKRTKSTKLFLQALYISFLVFAMDEREKRCSIHGGYIFINKVILK